MRNYFKRLKGHPGIMFAVILSLISFAAAASNRNIETVSEKIFLGAAGAAIWWAILLISNFKK